MMRKERSCICTPTSRPLITLLRINKSHNEISMDSHYENRDLQRKQKFPRVQFTRQRSSSPWTTFQHNETFGTWTLDILEWEQTSFPMLCSRVISGSALSSIFQWIPLNPCNTRNRLTTVKNINREVFDGLGYTPFFLSFSRGPRQQDKNHLWKINTWDIKCVPRHLADISKRSHTSPLTPPNFPAWYARNPKTAIDNNHIGS
jgi:hypothetical protein